MAETSGSPAVSRAGAQRAMESEWAGRGGGLFLRHGAPPRTTTGSRRDGSSKKNVAHTIGYGDSPRSDKVAPIMTEAERTALWWEGATR